MSDQPEQVSFKQYAEDVRNELKENRRQMMKDFGHEVIAVTGDQEGKVHSIYSSSDCEMEDGVTMRTTVVVQFTAVGVKPYKVKIKKQGLAL